MDFDILQERIDISKRKALDFFESLRSEEGIKYTANHDIAKYPSAELYGTWSYVLGKTLICTKDSFSEEDKRILKGALNKFRCADGTFYPIELSQIMNSKSHEYLKLHTTNYSVGAMLKLDSDFDFQSKFLDRFLDADTLQNWLNQRSFVRPWEESNNIVNVASYLALRDSHGDTKAKERLYQMLEWHNEFRNPRSGGFDKLSGSRGHIIQSMAGAVHNLHLYHYLGEEVEYANAIAQNVIPVLFEGPLTSCLSIDFVELACHVVDLVDSDTRRILSCALIYHLEALLKYQNVDGGWNEHESRKKPTVAAGMREASPSSCSYGTWFRLCSIAMINITLLCDRSMEWEFRSDLGMGYHNNNWSTLRISPEDLIRKYEYKFRLKNVPWKLKNKSIEVLSKIIS